MSYFNNPGSVSVAAPALPGGITNGNINVNVARPYSTTTMDVTALNYTAINKKLQMESVLDSVFEDLTSESTFTGKKMALPTSCIQKIRIERGAKAQVIPMMNPLPGALIVGTDGVVEGKERVPTLMYTKVYYNEYGYGVMEENWGMNYNELQVFNYYQEIQPRMSVFLKEDKDKRIHEALLETYDYILEGTGTNLTQNYNKNWFVANTDPGAQPTYSATPATFSANLNTVFAAADSGTNGVNANIDLNYLIALDYYASVRKQIKPVMIGGKKSYVVLLPSPQYQKLLQVTDGKLGSVWQNVTQLSSEEQNFPGIVGRVKSLVIVEDTRYPTLKCSNNYTDASHTVEYVNPANNDSRNFAVYSASSNAAWDIGFLLGDSAVIETVVTDPHFEQYKPGYGKTSGKAVFGEGAYQIGQYTTDTAGNGNLKNFSSIVLAFTATSIVDIA